MYIGNTTDIKLADWFSRAVDFSFDKVTRLAGWQVVFLKIKIEIKYARRCVYMHNSYRILQTEKLQLTSNPPRFLLLPKSPQSNLQILSLFQRPPIPIIRTLTRPLHTRQLPTLS